MTATDLANEIILVRSLADSDLGLFAAHRASANSKQRALNINADMARRLLSENLFVEGGASLNCICVYGNHVVRQARRLGKSGKNWRLGGRKVEGDIFAELDSKDLVLIRSRLGNDGSWPITMVLISKKRERVIHAGLAAIVAPKLEGSMAAFCTGDDGFTEFAAHCRALPWGRTTG